MPPEARNALRVTHPNICRIHEIHGGAGSSDFISMEFIEGETLLSRWRREPLPQSDAVEIARQLCRGLDAAHAAQVLHRDLKSGNVMLARQADSSIRAVIMDFGIALPFEERKVIKNVRASPVNGSGTYCFNYTDETTPHLTAITSDSSIGNLGYTFTMASTSLNSPFTGDPSTFGTTARLDTITGAFGLEHQITYNGNNSGELTKVTFPYGGSLAWLYRDFTFSDQRVIRDMQTRTLNDGINGNQAYTFWHDETLDFNTSNHSFTGVVDAYGLSFKRWTFDNTIGLQTHQYECSVATLLPVRGTDSYWAADSDGNPYIAITYAIIDYGASTQTIARTDQTRGKYGNLTQMKVYDYGNLSTPVRTYNNTYYQPGNYINNRLSTSTVTAGGSTTTLATNGYDQSNVNTICGHGGSTSGGTPNTAREFDPTYNGHVYRGSMTFTSSPGSALCLYYDAAGVILQTKDLYGHGTSSTPDPNHNYAVPSSVTTGNLTSTMTWNGAFQPVSSTNPNGATTGLTYDNYARPVSTSSAYGAATNSPATKTATTNGRWAKTTMDGFGRTVKMESGNGTTTLSSAETEYAPCGCTAMGKVKRVSQPHAPGATVYWTTYNYDALGRTISVSLPNNTGTTTYTYAGNSVTVTDPAQKWKKFTTDAMGNLTLVTEPNPKGGDNHLTYYTYNTFNQLVTVAMERRRVPENGTTITQTRNFAYDGNQRLQSVANPENGTTSYTYNADGTMNTKTDAKGQTLTYYYDPQGRLWKVQNGGNILRTFTYDSNGWGQYLNGRLARVDYGKWSELYSYHPAGGRTAKRLNYTWYNGQANLTQNLDAFWTYDTEGKVVSVKYPDTSALDNFGQASIPVIGDTYTYTFDAMGRASDLTTTMGDGTGSYKQVQGATYGPSGELTGLQYLQGATYTTDFNGNYYWQTAYTQESRSYNARMQLTTLSAGSASIVYNYSPTQDNGRITSMNNGMTGENVSYQYDSLNRLITAATADQSQWGLAFDYDGFGNRLSQTVTQGSAPTMTVAVDQATNRAGGAYDANGNMTSYNNLGMSYDAENRLLTAGTDTYDYAPDNKRIYKMSGQGNNQAEYVYYYSGSKKLATYQVIYYTPPGANQQTRFFFRLTGANIYFGGKLVQSEGSPVMTDRLGSIAGTRLYPYGEERSPGTSNERTKFATYFRDNATGLDYAANRYFSSQHGRFTSPDPYQASGQSADPQSWNRYAYVQNDPVNGIDPLGLDTWDPSTNTLNGDDDTPTGGGGSGLVGGGGGRRSNLLPILPTGDGSNGVGGGDGSGSSSNGGPTPCQPSGSGGGIGASIGASLDGGLANNNNGVGAASQVGMQSGGYYDSNNGFSAGGAITGGVAVVKGGQAAGAPAQSNVTIIGASASYGISVYYTNATNANQHVGDSTVYNFQAGAGFLQIGLSISVSSNNTYVISYSLPGMGIIWGISTSTYNTTSATNSSNGCK